VRRSDRPWIAREGTAEDLTALGELWRTLYQHQRRDGMSVEVPADGFERWAESMAPALGRFTSLHVAVEQGRVIGFVAGRVRTLPPYFGGGLTGFISEVFVSEAYRGQGVASKLVGEAVGWFRDSGIARVELQVIAGNDAARRLYARLGWRDELRQMVWESRPVSKEDSA